MRILRYFAALLVVSTAAYCQVPTPQLNLSGNVGGIGFPILNSGTISMTSDANLTLSISNVNTSCVSCKVTSTVSLTATRSIIFPAGRFFLNIENATTGGQPIQVIGPSGTGVTVANGATVGMWNDGTNYVQIGSSGSVFSVANSDSSLTVAPTTGSVVASLNTAHANVWTTGQTFAAGAALPSSAALSWNSDTGLSRGGASATVKVGNGAAGDASGTLDAAILNAGNINGTSVTATSFLTDSALTPGNCVQAGTLGLLTTTGSSCGFGTVSGQANGVVPLGTGATAIGAQSHISDNGSTVTISEATTFSGSGPPISILASKPCSPATATGQFCTDSSGNLDMSENNGAAARVCDATNGVCSGAALPTATAPGQIISSTASGTTYAVQGQVFYNQTGDTLASIETECSSLCTYVVTVPQTITLGSSHALSQNVQLAFQAGGQWTVNGAFTLTIPGNVTGTLNQHFAGSSTVKFGASQALVPAEWFGAVAVAKTSCAAGTDYTTQLQAALNSITTGQMLLQAGCYKAASATPLLVSASGVGIRGTISDEAIFDGTPLPQASIIMTNCATCDILDIFGPGSSLYISAGIFQDFGVESSVIRTGTASGIYLNHTISMTLKRLTSLDSPYGVRVHDSGSNATGSIDGVDVSYGYNGVTETSGNYSGFFLDSDDGVGNFSMVFTNCATNSNLSATPVVDGMLIHGSHVNDIFTYNQAASGTSYGLRVVYTGSGVSDSEADIHIYGAINDTIGVVGTLVSGLNFIGGGPSVEINGGWNTTSAGIPVEILNSTGVGVTSTWASTQGAEDFLVSGSSNITLANNHVLFNNAATTGILLTGSVDNTITANNIVLNNASANGIRFISSSNKNSAPGNMVSGVYNTGYFIDGSSINNNGFETSNADGTFTKDFSLNPSGNAVFFNQNPNVQTLDNSSYGQYTITTPAPSPVLAGLFGYSGTGTPDVPKNGGQVFLQGVNIPICIYAWLSDTACGMKMSASDDSTTFDAAMKVKGALTVDAPTTFVANFANSAVASGGAVGACMGKGATPGAGNSDCLVYFNIASFPYSSLQTFTSTLPQEISGSQIWLDVGPVYVGNSLGGAGGAYPSGGGLFNVGTTNQFQVSASGVATAAGLVSPTLNSGSTIGVTSSGGDIGFIVGSGHSITNTINGVSVLSLNSAATQSLVPIITLSPNAATSGANFNSPAIEWFGNYWTGSATANDVWLSVNTLGTGANPTSTLTFSHAGSSGASEVEFPTLSAAQYETNSFCASNTNPAVCGTSAAGFFNIATGATTVVVNTSIVTANSQIFLTPDATLSTALGVTCNSTLSIALAGVGVTARTPGTSFTVSTLGTIITNPACYSYHIIN